MNNLEYTIKKFKNNETVYLYNYLEDAVMKLIPSDGDYKCITKFKDGDVREVDKTSDLAVETELSGEQITKERYDNY